MFVCVSFRNIIESYLKTGQDLSRSYFQDGGIEEGEISYVGSFLIWARELIMQEQSHFALSDKEADVAGDQFHPRSSIQAKILVQNKFKLSSTSDTNL